MKPEYGRHSRTNSMLGLVSISDRASQGIYDDQGLPALKAWFSRALKSPFADA